MPNQFIRTSRRKGAEGLVDLRRSRQWFVDDLPPTDPLTSSIPQETSPNDLSAGNAASLLADLQKERAKRKAVEKRLAEEESARDEANRLAQESAGEWKALYESERKKRESVQTRISELEKYGTRVNALESVINDSNAEMIKKIPQDKLGLLPIDHMQPEEVYAFLPQWINQFAPPDPISIGEGGGDPNTPGGKKSKLTTHQQDAFDMGVRAGVWKVGDEDKYLAAVDKMGGGTFVQSSNGNREEEARQMIAQGQQMLQGTQ